MHQDTWNAVDRYFDDGLTTRDEARDKSCAKDG